MNLIGLDTLSILQKVKNSDLKREELNFLITKSYQISSSFLKTKFKSNLHFLKSEDHSIDDIAMDAIVPLFIKNNYGQLGIYKSLSKWKDPLITQADANYFLSRIIWRRVDQTVTKVFKERDPIFEKILKTIKVCIQNNNFERVRYFGTVLVVQNTESSLLGKIIDENSFNQIPEHYFGLRQTELLNKLFEYIITETNFRPALPLNMLVKRVKLYHSNRLAPKNDFVDSSEDSLVLNDLIKSGLKDVKQKLEVYYVSNNKLSKDEAELIYASFDNISKDMLNGGIKDSLFFYLSDYDKTLTRELFYAKYHHIMNYLLSLLKNNIAEKIYF